MFWQTVRIQFSYPQKLTNSVLYGIDSFPTVECPAAATEKCFLVQFNLPIRDYLAGKKYHPNE